MKSKENYGGFKGTIKIIANVISWTILVILILLALFLAYYMINTKLYASKGEKFEPIVSLYTIISGSMEPNIKIWDVVVSKKVNAPNEIKVGDVITFYSTSSISRGMIITHRVVEISEVDGKFVYKTKGDNNLSPDSAPAEYDNIIGKVILRVPQLGRVQDFLGTKGGWLIVIVIPALAIIINDILKIFKLAGVKNKIEKINEEDKKYKKEKARKEEIRKEILKNRLKIDKNFNEPDPIITKKMPRIVVGLKAPIIIELPNVKEADSQIKSKQSKKNRKSKTRTNNKK